MDYHLASVGDLHSLVCAERQEIIGIQLKPIFRGPQNIFKKIRVSIPAERSETHHFSFVSVFRIPDELADSRIKRSKRMRDKDAFQRLDLRSRALAHHARNEIARTVYSDPRRSIPRGSKIRTGSMSKVMLDVKSLEFELCRIDVTFAGDQRCQIVKCLALAANACEIEQPRRVPQSKLEFLVQICRRIAADGDKIDVGKRDAGNLKAPKDG